MIKVSWTAWTKKQTKIIISLLTGVILYMIICFVCRHYRILKDFSQSQLLYL